LEPEVIAIVGHTRLGTLLPCTNLVVYDPHGSEPCDLDL